MTIKILELSGANLTRALPDLARLRMAVFRDWPYCYEGSLDYEAGYLRWFAGSPGAVIIAALDGDTIVGASTAALLAGQMDMITTPIKAYGLALESVFYFGESVLLPRYRGQGLGKRFFELREEAARRHAGVRDACFCAVVRDEADPRKPKDHRTLEPLWRAQGFRPVAGLTCQLSWREVGQSEDTEKTMQFWKKALKP